MLKIYPRSKKVRMCLQGLCAQDLPKKMVPDATMARRRVRMFMAERGN